jgi:hypothetical protein
MLSPVRRDFSENGFSLLIKEPGLYNLNGISIEVRPFSGSDGKNGFFAVLPLVFRQSFNDDSLVFQGRKIKKRDLTENWLAAAEDMLGIAAFIGKAGVLFARDAFPEIYNGQNNLVEITCSYGRVDV